MSTLAPPRRLRSAPLVCRQVVELVTDFVEGALPWRVRRRLTQHVVRCANCAEYLRQIRVTITALARMTRSQP